ASLSVAAKAAGALLIALALPAWVYTQFEDFNEHEKGSIEEHKRRVAEMQASAARVIQGETAALNAQRGAHMAQIALLESRADKEAELKKELLDRQELEAMDAGGRRGAEMIGGNDPLVAHNERMSSEYEHQIAVNKEILD